MAFFRVADGSFLDGEGEIVSKQELMTIMSKCDKPCSRSTIQRYMRQGLPYTLFSDNKAGFNLIEAQDWLERNKNMTPGHLKQRWAEHREFMKAQKGKK